MQKLSSDFHKILENNISLVWTSQSHLGQKLTKSLLKKFEIWSNQIWLEI